MNTTHGAGTPKPDEETRVVQIYPTLLQEPETHFPLQLGIRDTARTVIRNAVVTLGLDSSLRYGLLEVRESGERETPLEDEDCPLLRVLLWPPEAQKWHRRSLGYYFALQRKDDDAAKRLETDLEDSDDLCNLSTVTEDTVLQVLRRRFYKRKIYTYISDILVAVNPNKFLPQYYNPKYVKMYEKQPLGRLSPHIFAVADVAFRAMLSRQVNQCIVISGESGSGKTESSSYLIHCLTAISQRTYSNRLERTILGAGPVLEAFGNAKTAENNNSSRFGKFIQLNYLESGVIRGAVIEKFLLDKSRLVSRDKTDRNYHVFYYLLMGASQDEREEFHLSKPQDYFYLSQDDLSSVEGEELGQEYKRLHQAMEMVGFLPSTKKHIFSILSAILHLGNVTFTLSKDSQVLEAGPADVLSTLSDLLKVKEELLVMALTERKQVTATSTVTSQYTLQEAVSLRDSMAKSLYGALFDWIILHINHALLNRRDMEESVSCLSIGVLDMFGFENLQTNSFEQLCINYTNEKLQHYINQNIFTYKQKDYIAEGITWQNIDFNDNHDCIHLISSKSVGLFTLLNEESKLPQATDETVLNKFKQQHRDNPLFEAPHRRESTFAIQHYAEKVKYHIKDFIKKNTEHMRPEVVALLRSSERSFLHHLVSSSPEALFRWGILRATIRIISVFKKMARQKAEPIAARRRSSKSLEYNKWRSSRKDRLSSSSMTLDFSFDHADEHPLDFFGDIFSSYEQRRKSRGSRHKQLIPKNLMNSHSLQHVAGLTRHDRTSKSIFHPQRREKLPTVSAQFETSLRKLIHTIERAKPFFIFCFRSNTEKKELYFDDEVVLKQLNYTGILQMVRMQKAGYRVKYLFKEFGKRFRILLPKGATGSPEVITELFERMGLDKTSYQIGKTKVFLKEKVRQLLLVTLNEEAMRRIITLQRWFRACLIRSHFLQKKDASLIIQRCWREFHEKQNRAATVIQTAWRSSSTKRRNQSEGEDENDPNTQSVLVSLGKKQLKRQDNLEQNSNKTQQSEQANSPSTQGRSILSPPSLSRPFSVPLDSTAGSILSTKSSTDSSIQHYTDVKIWREKLSEGDLTDEQSPEVQRRRKKRDDFYRTGKAMSADELSKTSSSESESSPSTEISAEPDGSRYSLPSRTSLEDSGHQGSNPSNESQVTTPDRVSFLGRFLKKRTAKHSPTSDFPSDKTVTLPRYTPQSYQSLNQNSGRVKRNPTICISRATRALQGNASLDREITDPKELRLLDEFLGNKVNELQSRIKELSPTEMIFLNATKEFRETIKSMYPVHYQVGYKDLVNSYHNTVKALAGPTSEVSLVVNLFQTVLDGFIRGEIKRADSETLKTTKKKRKKEKCFDSPLDHLFSTYQVNIMQSCDLCGSYIWAMEKAYMCSACKLICHKKCLNRIITDCSTRRASQDNSVPGSHHFGVQVCVLTSKVNPVPQVLEMLLMHVELNGLYSEGIYRKSGSACRARELHQVLETNPAKASLDNFPIHTITGLVKRWFRELPDPLMTFSLYSDFLHAVELPENAEKIRAVYQKIDELPPANYNTLERLIFHLVKVAKEEKYNKMTPSSLAIVFAPCILRSPDTDDPLLCMKDVPKTTLCVEILICEQLRRYNEKMQNIQELEYAEAQAVNKLKLRRQNTILEKPTEPNAPLHPDEFEITLIERIKSIKQEKVDMICGLTDMEHEHSDSEVLDDSSSMSTESLDLLGSLESEGYLKTQKPDFSHKPADLVQRVRNVMAETHTEQKELASRHSTNVPQTTSQEASSTTSNPQLANKTFNGNINDLDIPYIDEDED
ncbi:unconventional myosin-IXb isoform X2 [Austrofundulus limnaeus]|uniref:Unconventional myosin-IXb isoform X2 n=1 Tax=Austrofundulus limnaeus TaxID=52670 RepID=A0A2I4B560_AUSLI|nr:PREDICTED: unconventional myosin-IXb-like isoform X2 [Austrofundulus limnaeus]